MLRLLVVIAEPLSGLVAKGEVVPRCYNPRNMFDEVHVLATAADAVDREDVQPMVGDARLELHSMPAGAALFLKTFGWQLPLLARWAEEGVRLAERVRPDLVRSFGNFVNGFFAARVSRRLGVPLVVSLHGSPDEDLRALYRWRRQGLRRLALELHRKVERAVLRDADVVVCVYPYLLDYARRRGARRIEVIYNAVQQDRIVRKLQYRLHAPPRVVNVGRQIVQKDPSRLLRAAADIPGLRLTLIGDGPLHASLRRLAGRLGIESRTTFVPALPNREVCRTLAEFDLFASVNAFGGVSKAVLEAMSAGLPLLANRRTAETEPLVAGCGVFVEDTTDGFRRGLLALLGDEALRAELGVRARQASARVSAVAMEQEVADLYRSLLGSPQVCRA